MRSLTTLAIFALVLSLPLYAQHKRFMHNIKEATVAVMQLRRSMAWAAATSRHTARPHILHLHRILHPRKTITASSTMPKDIPKPRTFTRAQVNGWGTTPAAVTITTISIIPGSTGIFRE